MPVDFTFVGMVKQMSILAKGVGLTLVIMSIWSVHVTVDRMLAFRAMRRKSAKALDAAYERLSEGKLEQAIEAAQAEPNAGLALVMGGALASALVDRKRGKPPDLEAAERAVERERVNLIVSMRRGLTSLATIAATAPFVGLFGTVVGIINAFVGMAATGSGGLGAVSAGIAEALVTTAAGLAVAIPAVWVFNHFNARVEDLNADVDTIKAQVIDELARGTLANAA